MYVCVSPLVCVCIHILIYRRIYVLALILVSKHRSWLHLVLASDTRNGSARFELNPVEAFPAIKNHWFCGVRGLFGLEKGLVLTQSMTILANKIIKSLHACALPGLVFPASNV